MNSLMNGISNGEIAAMSLERKLDSAERAIKQLLVLIQSMEKRIARMEEKYRQQFGRLGGSVR